MNESVPSLRFENKLLNFCVEMFCLLCSWIRMFQLCGLSRTPLCPCFGHHTGTQLHNLHFSCNVKDNLSFYSSWYFIHMLAHKGKIELIQHYCLLLTLKQYGISLDRLRHHTTNPFNKNGTIYKVCSTEGSLMKGKNKLPITKTRTQFQ